MGVLKLKPHKIQKFLQSEGTYNDLGDWVAGTGEDLSEAFDCDAVRAGRAAIYAQTDGQKVTYTFVVYLYADCPMTFSVGESCLLTLANGEEYRLDVVGYEPLQLQKKLYLG